MEGAHLNLYHQTPLQKLTDSFKVYYKFENKNFFEALYRVLILSINKLKKIKKKLSLDEKKVALITRNNWNQDAILPSRDYY